MAACASWWSRTTGGSRPSFAAGSRSAVAAGKPAVEDDEVVAVDGHLLELANERKWHALINEQRAHDYGRDILGLQTVSVPELLVTVVFAGTLGKHEALHLLKKLANVTHAQLMQDATRLIERAP